MARATSFAKLTTALGRAMFGPTTQMGQRREYALAPDTEG
jgi:hypothetical protein